MADAAVTASAFAPKHFFLEGMLLYEGASAISPELNLPSRLIPDGNCVLFVFSFLFVVYND
jgi:hypothetical protein